MILFLSFLTLCFVFMAFLSHGSGQHNVLFAYYASLWEFILTNILLSLIGLVITIILLIKLTRFNNTYSFSKNVLLFIFQALESVLVGSFVGLCLLFCIAFLQLNILALTIEINPSLAGLITDSNTIMQTLKAKTVPPNILTTEDTKEREVIGVAQNTTGTNHVYGKNILPAIPNFFILPIKRPLSSMILADNTLIITKINAKDLQAVGPLLGYIFVKHYFPTRQIKSNSKISIMSEKEYLKHREDTTNQRIHQLDEEQHLVEDQVSSLSAGIQHDKDQLSYFQELADNANKQLNDQYIKCINAGEYRDSKYIHYYSESYCKTQQDNFNQLQESHDKEIKDWTNLLAYDQTQLQTYTLYGNFFKTQKVVAQIGKASFPDELGVFEPKDSIRIALQTSDAHAIVNYIETLIHEYLHFASFLPNKKLSSTFFEEGFTEYFARQAVQDSLHISTNLGYPVQVKIISAMTKRIDESELEDIYFTKDEDHLEKTVNRVYGDNFYRKNYSLFQALQYTSDPQQELKFANSIMKSIGGEQLNENDLESSFSSL